MKKIGFFILIFLMFQSCGDCVCFPPASSEHILAFSLKDQNKKDMLHHFLDEEIVLIFEDNRGRAIARHVWRVDKELINLGVLEIIYPSNCDRNTQDFSITIRGKIISGSISTKPMYPIWSCCRKTCESGKISHYQIEKKKEKVDVFPGGRLNITLTF